ncbi:MAG TPA: phosphoenolpyruvate--protein phosphotransferase [Phycisphaerales bacterium]|nr:phosphoenolpyruvate--protein phosphotransferase [Phycisphaerales bacterium]
MEIFKGIPVSSGVVIARVFVLDDVHVRIPKRQVPAGAEQAEQVRLETALKASLEDLDAMRRHAEEELGAEAAKIFAFHQGMLADPSLVKLIAERITKERVTAEWAVQEQFRLLAKRFEAMADPAFRTKVDDLWDLERRVLRHLIGEHRSALSRLDQPAVIVASDLTPSQAATFPRSHVLGFCTDLGGPTSHTAIFARALDIPAVVGCETLTQAAEDGDPIIIDGDRGVAILHPDEKTLEEYSGYIKEAQAFALSLAELKDLGAVTTDGVEIELLGNIEFASEVRSVLEDGGAGVGLFRTEFLWLTSDHEPTEQEQFEEYRLCAELAGGKTMVLRTFDLGADKATQERAGTPERNPFLGLRSIRYCLQNLPLFKRQLRAMLRATASGPMKIMFPLVSNVMELRQAKMILRDVMEDLEDEGIAFDRETKIGMMVETPSAAIMVHSFCREVDFFSIGTNDLIQYTLAVDRTNERVSKLYSGADPAVLRLMKEVARTAKRFNIPVSCCGELAGDTQYTMLLLGLGLRTLSVTPSRIPYVKRVIRSVDIGKCERLARTACSFDSDRQVIAYLRDQARKVIPEESGGRSAG